MTGAESGNPGWSMSGFNAVVWNGAGSVYLH